MTEFRGFPDKMEFTPVPNLAFSRVFLETDDVVELKATLYLISALYQKRGFPKYVTFSEMAASPELMAVMVAEGKEPVEVLSSSLGKTVARGVFLAVPVTGGEIKTELYFLNTPSNREVSEKIISGALTLGGLELAEPVAVPKPKLPDIFTAYEQNIGIITPLVADELKDIARLYPEEWVHEAIGEAVALNKRSLRYISRILENWAAGGKNDGTPGRSHKTNPDKYIQGKYGHIVKR
ncbi:DnaD domain-containing protein [Chloroflexota bacterium]